MIDENEKVIKVDYSRVHELECEDRYELLRHLVGVEYDYDTSRMANVSYEDCEQVREILSKLGLDEGKLE